MTTKNIFELVDTWNNAGTVFDAIAMAVTDTTSNAESNLVRYRIGASDVYRLRKDGCQIVRPTSLTGSSSQSIIDMAVTWNTSGTPTAFLLNVTDTASNASSLLMDLQVGGTSKFSVAKGTNVQISYDGNGPVIRSTAAAFAIRRQSTSSTAGAYFYGIGGETAQLVGARIGFGGIVQGPDTFFYPEANAINQINGTNAQTFRLYNTYTDASNYERGFMRWSSNILQIGAEKAGTGSNRVVEITGGNDVKLVVTNSTGNIGGVMTSSGTQLLTARGTGDVTILGSTLTINSLPTSSPGVAGRIWNDGGTLKVS